MRADQIKELIARGVDSETLKIVMEVMDRPSPKTLRNQRWEKNKASRKDAEKDANGTGTERPENVPETSLTASQKDAFGGTIGGNLISLEFKKERKTDSRERGPSRFPEFRASYPRRKGSMDWAQAEKVFDKLVAKGLSPETLIAGAGYYAREQDSLGNAGTSYIKMPATWLNKECWKDAEDTADESDAARYERAREAFRNGHSI